jgi:hypothetical protein
VSNNLINWGQVLIPISRNPRIFAEINKTTRKPGFVPVHVQKWVICALIMEKDDYDIGTHDPKPPANDELDYTYNDN